MVMSRDQNAGRSHIISAKLLSSTGLPRYLKIKIHRTVILRAVLYGSEHWSLTLREERRLRRLENRELRKIFRPTRD